ncbi:MAG: molybdate ABC transporter substrate-binding protein [Acidobacteriota bacterium]|nr:MAG: molybdate ABC transporter substrate-binding protein [Acidobacteriota bacterium]
MALRFLWTLVLATSILAGASCRSGEESRSRSPNVVYVSAAASLQFALPRIAQLFEEESGRQVILSFGASGSISQQIREGAPIDLFCSADQAWIQELESAGLLRESSVECYAMGILVLAYPPDAPGRLDSFEQLAKVQLERLGVSNPLLSPYGSAARDALVKLGCWDDLEDRVVYGENVGHILAYVEQGNVDFGFLPLSLAKARKLPYRVVPPRFYSPIRQYLGVPVSGENPAGGEDFARFLAGAHAQAVLTELGFGPPNELPGGASGAAVAE